MVRGSTNTCTLQLLAAEAPIQTAYSQESREKQSIVFGRVDGLAIPSWKQLQTKQFGNSSHFSWVGISAQEVRELGVWIYFKSEGASDPAVCSEARSILDTKLEEADMYQHLSFFRKMLSDCALSDMHSMLHHLVSAKALAKRRAETQQVAETNTCVANPDGNKEDLLVLYALFLEQHAQRTRRVVERRLRCIQLKQEVKEASNTERYPHIIYRSLWRNEQGAWSKFLHERDMEDMWLPL